MDSEKIFDLPDWEDSKLSFEDEREEGEAWKPNNTCLACKTLYEKWRAVVFILKGIVIPIIEKSTEENLHISNARDILADAYIVAAKIRSSEAGGLYILRMTNAAIIRQLAQSIATNMLLFSEDDLAEDTYIDAIRTEIDEFKTLFKEWVNTFEKDDITDDWGLFV